MFIELDKVTPLESFKPYYKWITFNTLEEELESIRNLCFKPYYKWITFNTIPTKKRTISLLVSFKPYYKWITFNTLNLNKNIDFVVF